MFRCVLLLVIPNCFCLAVQFREVESFERLPVPVDDAYSTYRLQQGQQLWIRGWGTGPRSYCT